MELCRQYTSTSFDEAEESRTVDEGTPKSSNSLALEDFPSKESLDMLQREMDLEAFQEMVQRQKLELKALEASRMSQWVNDMQTDLMRHVSPSLRLPGLIAEGYKYELAHLRSIESVSSNAVKIQSLKSDLRRSYTSLLREVKRAVKSDPPISVSGVPLVDPAQHRQKVADQGVQCYAAMLPFSDGICGAITEVRKVKAWERDESTDPENGFHELHIDPNSPTRGTAVGSSGRCIPVSLAAAHGKGEKVAAIRRRELVRAHTPAPKPRQGPVIVPIFARTHRPPLRNALGIPYTSVGH